MSNRLIAVILASSALATASAQAMTINFDDLVAGGTPVPNGYAGLNWKNFSVGNATLPQWIGTGYGVGAASLPYFAFNWYGNPATISATNATGFDLVDGFFTAAWNNALQVTVGAKFINGTTDTKSFLVDTTGPIDVSFNWTDLESVTFVSAGGTPVPGIGMGNQFIVDNLTIGDAQVPEAGSLALAGLALGLGVIVGRRRVIK